jgi:hypothetical protein
MPSWTCEICDQVVELRGDDRPHWSLQYHYVGNACIAYAQPEVAKELIMMAPATAE